MAFTKTNLRVLEDGTIGALATAKLWKYVVPVSDTITTSGYFTPDTGLKAGDVIMAVTATDVAFYIISGTSTLTATKMGSASAADGIPALPTPGATGTYVLKATVSGTTITYSWVAES